MLVHSFPIHIFIVYIVVDSKGLVNEYYTVCVSTHKIYMLV